MANFKFIELSYSAISRAVAILTLRRPPANVLNNLMQKELTQAFDYLTIRKDVSLVVLKADKCTGIDLHELTSRNLLHQQCTDFATMFDSISSSKKPTLGVMTGSLIGAGSTLAALCNHSITTTDSSFGYPERLFGLKPSISAPYAVARMGRANAIHYFSTGKTFDASIARKLSIVSEVCHRADIEKLTTQRIEDFLTNPDLFKLQRRTVDKSFEDDSLEDIQMVELVDKAMQLYADRSPDGRKKTIRDTASQLATDADTAVAQLLIKRYLADKELRRA